jgi:HprK-related kinase A
MRIGDLSTADLARHLRGTGLHLDTGAFIVRLRSDIDDLVDALAEAYANHPVETAEVVDHFDLALLAQSGLRRGGARAYVGGREALPPFPRSLAFPMLESMLNWCIAKQVLYLVAFHAGAVERDGKAVILTGPSGAGKSTLCAALSQSGWRLLSDEIVLVRPQGPVVLANPRPISLKNESIRRVGALAPQARFSRRYEETAKGTIAFLHPARDAVVRAAEPAAPRIVVLPTYRSDAAPGLRELEKAAGFMALVENSVNYFSTLRTGFDTLAAMTDACRFFALSYDDLTSAVDMLGQLVDAVPGAVEAA